MADTVMADAPSMNSAPAGDMKLGSEASIRSKLIAELNAGLDSEQQGLTYIDLQDLSGGCGQAWQATIVSTKFEGMNLLKRHRTVNKILKEDIDEIHAWTPKCYTPAQWELANSQN
ncbi:hypothetical protein N7462_007966 [Penicillium macrosclerotiorum]|uniref:uncharacterized protein n=1 Tax=Penicillium macrosclerotiorum TaxID=303699 RepID=UPI0025480626|nr:uncharacterized protein N7462_007966 [Penicillium macrosclerotiorum]KAJ5679722.1 hypothetical protein N7462_007966 [Penicillium macrosclerotiorum]